MIHRLRELQTGSSAPQDPPPDSQDPQTSNDSGEERGAGSKPPVLIGPAQNHSGSSARQQPGFADQGNPEEEPGQQPTCSSSWSELRPMLIGSDYSLSPLSPATEQRLILQYLTPLGDYQEVGEPDPPPR